MIIIDNEYLLIANDEIFRVYAPNEKLALDTFKRACVRFSDTKNEEFKIYWNNLFDAVQRNNYTIIQNSDFIGVRKV